MASVFSKEPKWYQKHQYSGDEKKKGSAGIQVKIGVSAGLREIESSQRESRRREAEREAPAPRAVGNLVWSKRRRVKVLESESESFHQE